MAIFNSYVTNYQTVVSEDYDSQYMESHKIHVPNHQPATPSDHIWKPLLFDLLLSVDLAPERLGASLASSIRKGSV
jgi:hypothetical protein